MGAFLYFLLAGAALVAGAAFILVHRARDFRKLVDDGVAARGVVVEKFLAGRRRSRPQPRVIGYTYRDGDGREHRIRSQVTEERYDALAEGDPIDIVYARAKPAVSAPAWFVEQARADFAKRRR